MKPVDLSKIELRPPPLELFARLDERRDRPRFMVPEGDSWRPITWGAFTQDVRAMACFTRDQGLAPGARVALLGPNSVSWLAGAHGAQVAGGVVVPIYPSSTADQAAYVAEHSDAELLFVDGEALLVRVLERWSAYAKVKRVVVLDESLALDAVVDTVRARGLPVPSYAELEARVVSWSRARARGLELDRQDPSLVPGMLSALRLDQPGLMIYTSGTTGNPKGVVLTHRNYATNTRDWMHTLVDRLGEDMVDLLWLPTSHIFGWGQVHNGNILGWTSWLCTPRDVMEQLPKVRPELFMSVPAYWEKIAQAAHGLEDPAARKAAVDAVTGGRLHFCLSGGAGLKPRVKEVLLSAGLLVIEGYGLTETSPTLTMNRPDDYRFDSVGKPFPTVRIKLAEDGEIWAKGDGVFAGYHKDPHATAEAFTPDGWFKTGDVGRFTTDGFLQIVDRKKEILVTAGGKNVPPQNIELRFKDDDLIANLVVYGDGKKFLVAGVWLNEVAAVAMMDAQGVPPESRPAALHALVSARIDKVNAELASYETIKRFVIFERALTVESGMLTPTLKLKRKKVYEAFGTELEALYA
jgi:long-chain acyl-CoA synthetase